MERKRAITLSLLAFAVSGAVTVSFCIWRGGGFASTAASSITEPNDAWAEGTRYELATDKYLATSFAPSPGNLTGLKSRQKRFVEWIVIAISAILPVIIGSAIPIGQAQNWREVDWVKVNTMLYMRPILSNALREATNITSPLFQVWQICDTGAPHDISNCFPTRAPAKTPFPFPLYARGTDFNDGYPAVEKGFSWLACYPYVPLWGLGRYAFCWETGMRITSSQPPSRYTDYANAPFFWVVCMPTFPLTDCFQTNVPRTEEFPYKLGHINETNPSVNTRLEGEEVVTLRTDFVACKNENVTLAYLDCWGVKLEKPAKGTESHYIA